MSKRHKYDRQKHRLGTQPQKNTATFSNLLAECGKSQSDIEQDTQELERQPGIDQGILMDPPSEYNRTEQQQRIHHVGCNFEPLTVYQR